MELSDKQLNILASGLIVIYYVVLVVAVIACILVVVDTVHTYTSCLETCCG